MEEVLFRTLPVIGKRVFRLGLAGNYGIDEAGIEWALSDTERRSVTAYTATRWRKLLKRPRGWDGKVPTAGDCYRFCLAEPKVSVVLTGPKNRTQLEANLDAVRTGPMPDDELCWMREFGKVVHG